MPFIAVSVCLTLAKYMCSPQKVSKHQFNKDKDKDKEDKDKDVFIHPKEFVSHMMMTQTKDRLYHQLK